MDRPERDGPKDQNSLDFAPPSADSDAVARPAGATPGNDQSGSRSGAADVAQNEGLNSVDILSDQRTPSTSPLRLPGENHVKAAPIGTAEMLSDETIKLHLEAESTDRKTHGDGELIIHPYEHDYPAIRRHIGDINPGEIKFVSPWLDNAGRITNDTPVKNDLLPQLTGPDTTSGAQSKGADSGSNPASTGAATDVIVPPSPAFDATVNKTFNAMSAETLEIIRQSGAKVKAVHHLTDAMPELKGQAPRGWPAGATWDAVDGCYSGGKKEIIVAEERQSLGNSKWVPSGRTEQVLRHETGHAVDATIKTLSEHDDFKQAYNQDVQAMQAKDKAQLDYFLQPGTAGREETVAESVADREGGATGGLTFHNDFANSLKVVNDTINTVGRTGATPPNAPLTTSQPPAVSSGAEQPTANTAGGITQPH
ncbi:MAG: hypothetical protein KGS72_18150 [Cyanobacteria bacterium REEB67]|nr:hypothetical protein [Cyanobacteria bacterium REEB67]